MTLLYPVVVMVAAQSGLHVHAFQGLPELLAMFVMPHITMLIAIFAPVKPLVGAMAHVMVKVDACVTIVSMVRVALFHATLQRNLRASSGVLIAG